MDLKLAIEEAFQASSIILVFVTLLFGLKYPVIIKVLEKEEPAGELAKKRYRNNLEKDLIIHCLPQLLFYFCASYLFSPLAIKIIVQTEISLWNFDFLITSYVIVTFWIWALLIWTSYLSYSLISKIKECNTK